MYLHPPSKFKTFFYVLLRKICWIGWVGVNTKFITWQSANQSEQSLYQSSEKIQFWLSISTKNMFCLRNDRSSLIGSIRCLWNQIVYNIVLQYCLWNQSNRSPTFSTYFCKGIVKKYDIIIPSKSPAWNYRLHWPSMWVPSSIRPYTILFLESFYWGKQYLGKAKMIYFINKTISKFNTNLLKANYKNYCSSKPV